MTGAAALPNGKRKEMLSDALNGLMELFKGRVLPFKAALADIINPWECLNGKGIVGVTPFRVK